MSDLAELGSIELPLLKWSRLSREVTLPPTYYLLPTTYQYRYLLVVGILLFPLGGALLRVRLLDAGAGELEMILLENFLEISKGLDFIKTTAGGGRKGQNQRLDRRFLIGTNEGDLFKHGRFSGGNGSHD
jgi:hypothetical protein